MTCHPRLGDELPDDVGVAVEVVRVDGLGGGGRQVNVLRVAGAAGACVDDFGGGGGAGGGVLDHDLAAALDVVAKVGGDGDDEVGVMAWGLLVRRGRAGRGAAG